MVCSWLGIRASGRSRYVKHNIKFVPKPALALVEKINH